MPLKHKMVIKIFSICGCNYKRALALIIQAEFADPVVKKEAEKKILGVVLIRKLLKLQT